MAGAAKNAAPAITIGIEMDSELLEQLMEIIEPMGLTPEMLIRRFLEWCVSPAIKDESNGYESWSVLLHMISQLSHFPLALGRRWMIQRLRPRHQILQVRRISIIDALMIAQYLMTVEYKPYPPSFYTLEKLKSLTRFRDSLIRQRSRQLVELTNILDKVFPEFKPFFKGRFSATALYILSHYASPEKISNMNSKSYEPLRRLSRGRFSMVDFVELKTLARNTVGSTCDYLLQEMEITIDIYNQLQSKVEEVELQINDCVLGLAPPMLTVPGIGAASAAVILSEFGDFSRFKSPAKLLSFAGLEPGYFQSGTSESTGKMVKHGSSHLRYAIMNCAQTVVNNEPTFATYYTKKRAEGKEHRVALTHVAKKLLRVIYTLQTKEQSYNPDLVR